MFYCKANTPEQAVERAQLFFRGSANVVSVVGGESTDGQISQLRRGAHIVIGTPGRIVDMINTRMLPFRQCSVVILEEVGRMIDMGYEPQVCTCVECV